MGIGMANLVLFPFLAGDRLDTLRAERSSDRRFTHVGEECQLRHPEVVAVIQIASGKKVSRTCRIFFGFNSLSGVGSPLKSVCGKPVTMAATSCRCSSTVNVSSKMSPHWYVW